MFCMAVAISTNILSITPTLNLTDTAFCMAVGFGPNKVGAVEALLEAGANPAHVLDTGATVLMLAAQNHDADAALVRRLLRIPEVAQASVLPPSCAATVASSAPHHFASVLLP